MRVEITELQECVKQAILQYGYTEAEANIIGDVLMYAQLRGNNQGIVKLIGLGIPKDMLTGAITTEHETTVSALINAHNNHAMIALDHATQVAMSKAKLSGVGIVGVNHVNTSSGAIGFYARRIASDGLIGIVFAGASPVVAPEGSYEPTFGTNPLAVAVPSNSAPVVLDMATAAMAVFGVIEARTARRSLPPDIAYDKEGRLTTDPSEALEGALRTFDQGRKGSGLSFMVQALTGPLVGASFVGLGDVATNWGGHLVVALDPELLTGAEAMRQGVSAMVERVKGSKLLPGVEEILVPGERGDRLAATAVQMGQIDVEDNLYHELRRVCGRGHEHTNGE